MANIPLESITFPGLTNRYTIPTVDNTLTTTGAAADAKKTGDEIADLKADLNLKANIDGSYEGMTVGNAEQLLSTTYTEDSVPYLYRTSGGSADIGDREEDVIVGGSVVWNQLLDKTKYPETQTVEGVTFTNNGDGSWTINGTATNVAVIDLNNNIAIDEIKTGHKYMAIVGSGFSGGSATYELQLFRFQSRDSWDVYKNGIIATSATNTNITLVRLVVRSGATVTNVKCCPQLFDLTAMFGATVADAIYSAEQASAGAGVKLFRNLFPKSYYTYDAGTLKSVEGLTAHKMVGFNQWDEVWEVGGIGGDGSPVTDRTKIRSKNFIPIFPGVTYYCVTPNLATYVLFFDRSKTVIGNFVDVTNKTFTVPADAAYCKLRVGNNSYPITTYNNDICINLSWSGYRNGEYEAYKEYSYPLDSTLTLRGITKVDASGNLYYDGDRYLPDGTVERRYGVRAYQEGDESLADVITDGTNTVYKLTTATTESADPYQTPQIVDDFGTEEYVIDSQIAVPVPVGHETKYLVNLRDKLQHLPDLASGDGYYLIHQVGHEMNLIHFRIPQAPSADGTYTLKATVSGGTPTYTWEVVS